MFVGVSAQFEKDIVDRRVELRQMEGLVEHRRVNSPEEKIDRRIVLVTGKKNEPLSISRPDPRHRPVKHLAPDLRHHHVANDEIEGALHDLAQALDTVPDGGDLIRVEDQVVVENLPEIITILQEQNSQGRSPARRLHLLVNVESDDLHGIGNGIGSSPAHRPSRLARQVPLGLNLPGDRREIVLGHENIDLGGGYCGHGIGCNDGRGAGADGLGQRN